MRSRCPRRFNRERDIAEHPKHGSLVDVVALPLTQLDGVELVEHSLFENQNISVEVSDKVSVVGYPFGLRAAGAKAVWATGYVASEMSEDYEGLPAFLVDCRSRAGQSGSPVIAYGTAFTDRDSLVVHDRPMTRLMGVYSGRVNAESDLGIVWKIRAVAEILDSMPAKR